MAGSSSGVRRWPLKQQICKEDQDHDDQHDLGHQIAKTADASGKFGFGDATGDGGGDGGELGSLAGMDDRHDRGAATHRGSREHGIAALSDRRLRSG